jgi:hypothetical protein
LPLFKSINMDGFNSSQSDFFAHLESSDVYLVENDEHIAQNKFGTLVELSLWEIHKTST